MANSELEFEGAAQAVQGDSGRAVVTKDTPASRIRAYLEREGLSPADLAEAAETTPEQLQAILDGGRVPVGLGWRLAVAMRCSVVWLWPPKRKAPSAND